MAEALANVDVRQYNIQERLIPEADFWTGVTYG